MKLKVAIKGAEFYAYHGYYEEERKAGNTFIIDAEIELRSIDTFDDNMLDTINYEHIYAICKQEMSHSHQLLETVVYKIINQFRENFKNMTAAKVRLEKIGPQLGGKVEKSVIEMEI